VAAGRSWAPLKARTCGAMSCTGSQTLAFETLTQGVHAVLSSTWRAFRSKARGAGPYSSLRRARFFDRRLKA
jgi:hypothetical protein